MKELCDYIIRILDTYFPQYYKNRKARLTAPLDIPLVQKAAVEDSDPAGEDKGDLSGRPADEPETETQGLTDGGFRISAAPAAEKNGNETGEKPMGTAGFVILHYGDRETTDACVRSVLKMKDQERIRIIIVDNDIEKTEDERRKLKEAYRDNSRITVLKVRSGGGFSQANNLDTGSQGKNFRRPLLLY